MSDMVRKDGQSDYSVDRDLDDDIGEVLEDIEEVLSTRTPPMTGWSSIPPARESVDDLAELAAQLDDDSDRDTPVISVESVEMDASDFGYDEPTHDWTVMPMPPDSFPSAAHSIGESVEQAPETLRPSAISVEPYRPQPKRRVPVGLAVGAAVAVAAAIVSYRLGPQYRLEPHANAPAETSRYVAAQTHAAPQQTLHAASDRPVSAAPQPLSVTVNPAHAFLSVRALDDAEGKHTTGPWPRIFELKPGEYELVAFRRGHKSVIRRITIEPGVKPPAMELKLRVDDIYE